MDQPAGTCIFLTGAPEAVDLDWSEVRLLSDFTIGQKHISPATQPPATTLSWQPPKWRDVDLPRGKLTNRLGKRRQREESPQKPMSFSFGMPSLPLATQQPGFLEHSMALLDNLASSQIAPAAGDEESTVFGGQQTILSFVSDWSDTSYGMSDSFLLPDGDPNSGVLQNIGPVTDLKAVPNAEHIQGIIPQTLTVNVLAAVINVSQPRVVTLRNSGRAMEILELLLGDETRAGFSVSFWLVPLEESQKRRSTAEELALRASLTSLRPGDLVAIGSVALSAFKGVVYGQSLNRRVTRNSTWVAKIGDDVKTDGMLGWKMNRVREWAEQFVGGDVGKANVHRTKAFEAVMEVEDDLPPDTQDT